MLTCSLHHLLTCWPVHDIVFWHETMVQIMNLPTLTSGGQRYRDQEWGLDLVETDDQEVPEEKSTRRGRGWSRCCLLILRVGLLLLIVFLLLLIVGLLVLRVGLLVLRSGLLLLIIGLLLKTVALCEPILAESALFFESWNRSLCQETHKRLCTHCVPCKDSKSGDSVSVRCEVKKVLYTCVWSSINIIVLTTFEVAFQKLHDEETFVCDSFYWEIDERLETCCL